ncbi:class I SAM-dependent methyltransferase [candidate division KSB1 bacterium]|nr:class I SAM-dependent methyltransferase [candidate division KSB1 bacterium]
METKLIQSGLRILDESYHYLENPETVNQGMDLLFDGLYTKRSESNKESWRHFCENVCLNHPIQALLHQDPLTLRSFSKPRGYPGDAVLLDFIYRHPAQEDELEKASPIGRAVCEYMVSRPAAESVRWRRELLSQLFDETVKRVQNAEILSVACGHLREAANSMAIQNNLVHRFIAFDQDYASLKTIEAEKNGTNIDCVRGTIKELIRRKIKLGKFDFIYVAGLYDYLSDGAAQLLTKSLFSMLKENGRLLIANFMPSNPDMGYMEAFMGWELLYRTREEFEQTVGPLEKNIQKIYFDDNWHVVYLELRKR